MHKYKDLIERAYQMLKEGKEEESREQLRDIVLGQIKNRESLKKYNAEDYIKLGECCNLVGLYTEAVKSFSEAVRLAPNRDNTWLHLGNILQNNGKHEKAISAFERAIAINPNLQEAHAKLLQSRIYTAFNISSQHCDVNNILDGIAKLLKSNKDILGKIAFQPFFEWLYLYSITGMNYGGIVDNIHISGELFAIQHVAKHIAPEKNSIVFDVGANKGEFSLKVFEHFYQNVTVYCFEPSILIFKELQHALKEFPNAKLLNIALGLENETVTMYGHTSSSGLEVCSENVRKKAMDYTERVNFVRLDDFCKQHHIDHIDYLKMDVEGCELNILKSARNMINSDSIDFIHFEFNHPNIYLKVFFKDYYDFLSPKYNIYRILQDGLCPVQNYSEHCEIFANSNYLAIANWIK
ncbi:MAG: FkbM family methyltransferase [Candidatus Kuenenia sp.]|nr:FkbM family methyltransferase [Candidatus Kuenenia hertensis]